MATTDYFILNLPHTVSFFFFPPTQCFFFLAHLDLPLNGEGKFDQTEVCNTKTATLGPGPCSLAEE